VIEEFLLAERDLFAMRFAGQTQEKVHRALRVTNRYVDTWLLLLRRPERSLSGDAFMDLIALLIQIISRAVRETIWAVRSKIEK
jgi:hypothetical protein